MKNDYEMTLNGESTVIPCEDNCDVPRVQCDFVSIGDLESKEKDAIVGEEVGEGAREIGAEKRLVAAGGVVSGWRGCGRPLHLLVCAAQLLVSPGPGGVLNRDQRLRRQDLSLRRQGFTVALGSSPTIRLCEPFQGQFQASASFYFCLEPE